MTGQTIETVRTVSASTTYGAGGMVAAAQTAKKIDPQWVEWVNGHSIIIGIAIALCGLMVNICTNAISLYLQAKAKGNWNRK